MSAEIYIDKLIAIMYGEGRKEQKREGGRGGGEREKERFNFTHLIWCPERLSIIFIVPSSSAIYFLFQSLEMKKESHLLYFHCTVNLGCL